VNITGRLKGRSKLKGGERLQVEKKMMYLNFNRNKITKSTVFQTEGTRDDGDASCKSERSEYELQSSLLALQFTEGLERKGEEYSVRYHHRLI
jgi:hypothetical protein